MITAFFGDVPAGTSCATQTSCSVIVPDLGSPGAVTVTVSTATGTSNAVPFGYW